jgi:hypothetical protein
MKIKGCEGWVEADLSMPSSMASTEGLQHMVTFTIYAVNRAVKLLQCGVRTPKLQ